MADYLDSPLEYKMDWRVLFWPIYFFIVANIAKILTKYAVWGIDDYANSEYVNYKRCEDVQSKDERLIKGEGPGETDRKMTSYTIVKEGTSNHAQSSALNHLVSSPTTDIQLHTPRVNLSTRALTHAGPINEPTPLCRGWQRDGVLSLCRLHFAATRHTSLSVCSGTVLPTIVSEIRVDEVAAGQAEVRLDDETSIQE